MIKQPNETFEDAEIAGDRTLAEIVAALNNRKNFKVEAGAGAGKTYSLVQSLRYILDKKPRYLPREHQRVACLTYTRVARDEIKARTDGNPAIFAETLHGFLWEMIRPYQKALMHSLQNSEKWEKYRTGNEDISGLKIEYDLGVRGIHKDRITLHHEDIPAFAIEIFAYEKFRLLLADRFPVIFIDEYQDTPAGLAEAFLAGHEKDRISPIIGFFGDHWQKIYDKTCGTIDHPSLISISKKANFRSDKAIVNFLNKQRPNLPQAPQQDAGEGTVTIYHSNSWPGDRLAKQFSGQISPDAIKECLHWLQSCSPSSRWAQFLNNPRVLMLTHASIANELGYSSLVNVFRYNSSFVNKENPVIEYLVDVIEPAIEAFSERRFGELFQLLGDKKPLLNHPGDKNLWSNFFKEIKSISNTGTVGDVLEYLGGQNRISLPTRVVEMEQTHKFVDGGEKLELSSSEKEHQMLRSVPYAEVRALRSYLENQTVFSTKHSVKGAEFDDVIVLAGRGWSKYNFDKMIENSAEPESTQNQTFLNSRNLFYVATSRARHNLAILFVHKLSEKSLEILAEWVGQENVICIDFDNMGHPIPVEAVQ